MIIFNFQSLQLAKYSSLKNAMQDMFLRAYAGLLLKPVAKNCPIMRISFV